MRKLETYVNEKLKVTKSSSVPTLISILESTDRKEYTLQCEKLLEYLKYDIDLPVAELKDKHNYLKWLDGKYKNGNDTFLWIGDVIFYGTWNDMYSMSWSTQFKVRNYKNGRDGFKDFVCNDNEIIKSKGVFIITENDVLMEQIDILNKKADHIK